MAQQTQIRTVVKGFDLASACRRAGLEEGEVFVAATPADENGGGYWVCSWDGAEAHDLSPRHPYETEAEAIEAAREALAQRVDAMPDDVRAAVIAAAESAARVFAEEFPGERITGDWDSMGYAIDKRGHDWPDEAWDLYRETLHARVNATLAQR